jgi:hypothetical protein
MTDVYEHNPGDHEDPVPASTWLIGFLGAVLLAVICMGIVALTYSEERVEFVNKVESVPVENIQNLKQEQMDRLTGPVRWQVTKTDALPEDRALIIPIDQAMEAIIKEYGNE